MVNNKRNTTPKRCFQPSATRRNQPSNASASQQLSSLLLNGTSRKGLSITNKRGQRLLRTLLWRLALSDMQVSVLADIREKYWTLRLRELFSMLLTTSPRRWASTGLLRQIEKASGRLSLPRMKVREYLKQIS